MAWTYTASPFAYPPTVQTTIDSVRFLVADTNAGDPQLQDGEIAGLLLQNSGDPTGATTNTQDVYQTAIAAATSLMAKYTRLANRTVGDLSIDYASVAKQYQALIAQLSAQAIRHSSPIPYAGGISLGDMEIDQGDDDVNQPNFSIGMDDNPDTAVSITGGNSGFSQAVPAG
jgi:hypothetical protein